jgi:transcriptional regulator with XRE-family HTH domain
MSHLVKLIDDYKDTHGGPSDSSIARAIGVAPQTISSWRKRGIRQLPEQETLAALARLIGVDYNTGVMPAVLVDIGYMDEEELEEDPDPVPNSDVG